MQLFEWPALAWLALAIVAAVVAVSSGGTILQVVTFAFVIVGSFAVLRPWFVARAGGRGIPSRTSIRPKKFA
jgi:membrane protein implicated in regulation of membrane protease activity